MTGDRKIKVCFFSRRYPGFGDNHRFRDVFERYFFWIREFRSTSVEPFFIVGSNRDEVTSFDGHTIYLVRDVTRSSPVSVNRSFIRKSAGIISEENAGIVHCHNLADILSHFLLRRQCPESVSFLVQDHGSVYTGVFRLVRYFFRRMDGFVFNSPGQERLWVKKGIFPPGKAHFLPEGSSPFAGIAQDDGTAGVAGPRLLWVGNLDPNKDPLTILKGIKLVLPAYPGLHLTMIYGKATLEEDVRSFIRENRMEANAELIGKVPFHEMPDHYSANDYFILGSRKEGSGYAAIEALSMGLVAVLSNIDSFAHITGNGRVGALFRQGDPADLSVKLQEIFNRDLQKEKATAREHFQNEWSPVALVRKYEELYGRMKKDTEG